MNSKWIVIALLLLASILSGVFTSKSGRPLATGIFTVHKLIALAALVMSMVAAFQKIKLMPDMFTHLFVAAIFVFAITLFLSGALLSFEKMAPLFVLRIHQVAPVLLVLAAVVLAFYRD